MKKQIISMIIISVILSIQSFGQNKVVLVNGNSFDASSVKVKRTVEIVVNGQSKSIPKADILYIAPNGNKAYTFSRKNNKKIKIAGRDIKNNLQGTDVPRLYAYKFFKTKSEVKDIYKMYPANSLTFDEFEQEYYAQNQKLRTRATVSTISSVIIGALIVVRYAAM